MAPNTVIFDPVPSEYASEVFANIGKILYLSEELADFHFICKSSDDDGMRERVPAHKFLLISGSDVFRAMFNESWIEKTEVEIKDASADAFKEFLQFFYSGKIELTMANAGEVMNLGNKYDVAECFNICAKFLKNNINNDSVRSIYELAVHLEHKELVKYCEIFIGLNTKAVLASKGFQKCDPKTVKRILQMDTLDCTEAEAFEALMNWIKAKTKQNELTNEIVHGQFGDLVHEIRFGLISIQEFGKIDFSYRNVFTLDEHREIIQMMASKDFQPTIFNGNHRNRVESIQWNQNEMIECNCYVLYDYIVTPHYIKNIETTTFNVNRPALLGAFICTKVHVYKNNGYYPMTGNLSSKIEIVEMRGSNDDDRVVLYSGQSELESKCFKRILLPKPILIRPGFKYEIIMEQSPPGKSCTGHVLKTKVEIEPDITVQFHHDSLSNANTTSRGLIAKLELNDI